MEKMLSQTQKQSQGSGGNSVSGYNVVICLNALTLSLPVCRYAPWGRGKEVWSQVNLTGSGYHTGAKESLLGNPSKKMSN